MTAPNAQPWYAVARRAGPPPVLPLSAPGQRIGLLGGSFNPPHAGHRHLALAALGRFKLDQVWMLVTPGNPLKDTTGLPSLSDRIAAVTRVARHPAIKVTGIEAMIGTRYTAETLAYLRSRLRDRHLVWLMGADNLAGFHRWRDWREIATTLPIGIIDRPGYTLRSMASPAALALGRYRLDETDAALLATSSAPAWVFLHGPRSHLSSTALRAGST
ncbi:MAG: nicotinate-nucleotide adenylyltransferase [Pseudomonadota bacterium]